MNLYMCMKANVCMRMYTVSRFYYTLCYCNSFMHAYLCTYIHLIRIYMYIGMGVAESSYTMLCMLYNPPWPALTVLGLWGTAATGRPG